MAIVWDNQAGSQGSNSTSSVQWDQGASTEPGLTPQVSPFVQNVAKYAPMAFGAIDPVQSLINRIPQQALEPALSAVGGTVGAFSPHPFLGSTIGSGLGSAVGQAEGMVRQLGEGRQPAPFNIGKSTMERPAQAAIGYGVGKAVGGVTQAGKYLFPKQAAQFGEALSNKFGDLNVQAMKMFGADLKAVGGSADVKPVISTIVRNSADPTFGRNLSRSIDVYRLKFPEGAEVMDKFLENSALAGNATANELQHVKNILRDVPGAELELRQISHAQEGINPKAIGQLNAKYGASMGDIGHLKPFLENPVGISKRVAGAASDPNFQEVAGRQLGPEMAGQIAPFARAERIREIPGKMGETLVRVAPRIAAYGAAGLAARELLRKR